MVEIPNLIDELAINYLAASVDKSRHELILKEFFEKNPRTLQAALQIFEQRITLQEACGVFNLHDLNILEEVEKMRCFGGRDRDH